MKVNTFVGICIGGILAIISFPGLQFIGKCEDTMGIDAMALPDITDDKNWVEYESPPIREIDFRLGEPFYTKWGLKDANEGDLFVIQLEKKDKDTCSLALVKVTNKMEIMEIDK